MIALKYWRLERQFSQIELALAAGLPRYKIQQFELGIRSPDENELIALAMAMGLKESDLAPNAQDLELGGSNV